MKFRLELTELKYQPGDKVRFVPKHRQYEYWERALSGNLAIVQDYDILPTVKFLRTSGQAQGRSITAVHQDDLVPA